jgi:hypothetical protein
LISHLNNLLETNISQYTSKSANVLNETRYANSVKNLVNENLHNGVENLNLCNGAKNTNLCIGAKNISPLRSPSKTIGSVVRGFKIGVTKCM